MSLIEALDAKLIEIAELRGALALLAWDQETNMPAGGSARRARQVALLSGIRHEKFVKEFAPLLEEAEALDPKEMTERQRLGLVQLRRDVDRQLKLPKEHVMELSRISSESTHAWISARKEDDWSAFQPFLEKLLDLKKREAEYLGYESNPYDALLDNFDPGLKTTRLEEVFEGLKGKLKPLLEAIRQAPQVEEAFLLQEVAEEVQLKFGEKVVEAMGYSFKSGRQDISAHPFTIAMAPSDVRITTAVQGNDIRTMLYSSVHEGGHAIYEQGLNEAELGWPASEACSLSVHESQSRLWENNVARTHEFWQHFSPQLKAMYPDQLGEHGAWDIYKAVNRVEPGLIRIHSDELTYHFHIILRFEIENDLVNGRISVADLPTIWNEKIKQYLGLDVPSNQKGVLQDIHWSFGNFGYFPTYSLGSLYAAQMMAAAERDLAGLKGNIQRGEFAPLKTWLNEKIHHPGRLYSAEELCTAVTGEPLNVDYFVDYAWAKFGGIYGLN